MASIPENEPITINLLSLNCHLPVGSQGQDQIYLKYNGNRLFPKKSKYQRFHQGQGNKIENVSLTFMNIKEVDTVVIELWYRKNLVQNALAGRFFLMLNISEIGFSATQMIRNSEQGESHYLLHWELRSLKDIKSKVEETAKANYTSDEIE